MTSRISIRAIGLATVPLKYRRSSMQGSIWRGTKAVAAAAVLLLLAGCSSLGDIEGPPPAFDMDTDIAELQTQYGSATSIHSYYAAAPETKERRDEFIVGRLTLINLKYLRYIEQFPAETAAFSSALDITKLGLDLAATAVGAAATKTILTAISAGLLGSRLSIEKNFFDQKTSTALVAAMNAQRKASLVALVAGMHASVADYPLASAVVDLDAYYYAGTLPGALAAVEADAGKKDAAAQKQIDQFRVVSFMPDDTTTRIFNWLFPNATLAADGSPLDAAGKPMTAKADNVKALRGWLKDNGLDGLTIAAFMNSGSLAADRTKAATDLKIPK